MSCWNILYYLSLFVLLLSILLNILSHDEKKSVLKKKMEEQNIIKLKIMNYLENLENEEIQDKKENIEYVKNRIYPYLGLERFSIPMISTVSAGKSSTLNFLLNLKNNILQIGEKATTKFCVIIRHNKNFKRGKIYNVKIKRRAEINKYNFHKAEEINEDIKTFIEKRNNLIQAFQNDDRKIMDPSLLFIIMEIDTGLFEGEMEQYSQLVEFIDIPGLNEKEGEYKLYIQNVLPLIKMNFLFPILIIDCTKFESTDTFDIFKKVFEPYVSKFINENGYFVKNTLFDRDNQILTLNNIKAKSFFIVNKLNLHKEHERGNYLKKVLNKTSKELGIEVKTDKNLFIINAKAKNLEVNKYLSLLNFTEYIFNKEDLKPGTELLELLINSFKEYFNYKIPEKIDKIKNNYKNAKGYEQYLNLIKKYKKIDFDIFDESYFNFFSSIFDELISNSSVIKKMDSDGIRLKKAIINKIKEYIDIFLDDKNIIEMMRLLNISEEKLNNQYFEYKELRNPLESINKLNSIVKRLKLIGKDNKGIIKLNDNYDDLIKYIKKGIFVHYIIIGSFSSGKSFTLNNMIGYNYNLLEFGEGEVTNHAFIIRNSKDINLYKAVIEKNKFGYFFKKTIKIASGKNDVKQKIKEVNKRIKEFSYFILETPLKIFENIYINENVINSIEIIDFPGLDTEKAKNDKFLEGNNKILSKNIINGFFYVAEPITVEINSVSNVFKDGIIKNFIYDDSNVEDIDNCLFLFTKNKDNEQENFYDIDAKSLIFKLIQDIEKKNMDMADIIKEREKINKTHITFAKLSNIDYLNYMLYEEKLNNFTSFIGNIIKFKKGKIKNLQNLFRIIDSHIQKEIKIKENFMKTIFRDSFKDNVKEDIFEIYNINDIGPFIETFRKELIKIKLINENYKFNEEELNKTEKYAKKYLYLKDHLKENEYYIKSFYEDFSNKVKHIMSYAEGIKNRKLNYFLNDLIRQAKTIFKILDERFTISQNDYNAKYSLKVKEKIIDYININFAFLTNKLNISTQEMKQNIASTMEKLNCSGNDPDKFRKEFDGVKEEVKFKIGNTTSFIQNEIEQFYHIIMKSISNYTDFEDDEKFKKQKNEIQKVKIENKYKNINFETIGNLRYYTVKIITFGLASYSFQEDINKTCQNFTEMLSSVYNTFEKDAFEKLDDLKIKGEDLINLIFITATSNFQQIKDNIDKFYEIMQTFKDFLRDNYL